MFKTLIALAALFGLMMGQDEAAEAKKAAPVAELATLGGGCFWCVEAALEQLRGVESVTSGYAGGSMKDPSYKAVCTGATGHAEVVQVKFDAKVISYHDLLKAFFVVHDPTSMNRQGADVGTQYRSVIFTHSPEQAKVARQVIDELTKAKVFPNPIVTELKPLEAFYAAEDYHQDYFAKNPDQPYCMAVVAPKVAKLRHSFLDKLKK